MKSSFLGILSTCLCVGFVVSGCSKEGATAPTAIATTKKATPGKVAVPQPARSPIGKNMQEKLDADLIAAAREGQTAQVRLLLDKGADVNARGSSQHYRYGTYTSTPLIEAASSRKIELVRLLLDKGAKVNAVSEGGETALMHAAEVADTATMKLLLARGAITKMQDEMNRDAMFYAINSCSIPSVKVLMQAGMSIKDKPAQKGMRFAIEDCEDAPGNKVYTIIKYLLDNGADANARGFEEFDDSKTILMIACGAPHGRERYAVSCPIIARLLLKHGAKVNLRDEDGKTALFYAKDPDGSKETRDLVRALKVAGAKE